jgi:Fe-S-cluster-containing dehydrogenase component
VTCLPQPRPGQKKLGLVIDLDTCVGCHACATACKSWNTSGHPGPLADTDPYGASPEGAWLNRVHTFEAGEGADSRTVHFPRSCLHCENAACVTVCPTGASYKRPEDGIVLVNAETCIGCGLCAWALPLRRARARPALEGHEEVHALHRPNLQREPWTRATASPPA